MTALTEAATTFEVDAAVATTTPKDPADNQDRARTVLAPDGTAAVLCDGVGSYAASGDVAERCLSLACGHIAIEGVGAGVVSCADAAAHLMADDARLPEGATTLLTVGASMDGHAYFSLVGNGAIFAIEPLSVRDGRAELLTSELVLPHCEIEGSQAALRSFLPAPRMPIETTTGILLPRHGRPRILLACSDGITTAEECEVGRVPSTGAVWARRRPPFVEIIATLEQIWGELTAASDATEVLSTSLADCLDSIRDRGLLEDDATVAAVFVRPADDEMRVGSEGAAR